VYLISTSCHYFLRPSWHLLKIPKVCPFWTRGGQNLDPKIVSKHNSVIVVRSDLVRTVPRFDIVTVLPKSMGNMPLGYTHTLIDILGL